MNIEYRPLPVLDYSYLICSNYVYYTNIKQKHDKYYVNELKYASHITINIINKDEIEIVKNCHNSYTGIFPTEYLKNIENKFPGIFDICKIIRVGQLLRKEIDTTPQFEIL